MDADIDQRRDGLAAVWAFGAQQAKLRIGRPGGAAALTLLPGVAKAGRIARNTGGTSAESRGGEIGNGLVMARMV